MHISSGADQERTCVSEERSEIICSVYTIGGCSDPSGQKRVGISKVENDVVRMTKSMVRRNAGIQAAKHLRRSTRAVTACRSNNFMEGRGNERFRCPNAVRWFERAHLRKLDGRYAGIFNWNRKLPRIRQVIFLNEVLNIKGSVTPAMAKLIKIAASAP